MVNLFQQGGPVGKQALESLRGRIAGSHVAKNAARGQLSVNGRGTQFTLQFHPLARFRAQGDRKFADRIICLETRQHTQASGVEIGARVSGVNPKEAKVAAYLIAEPAMVPSSLDDLKRYRSAGVARVNVGVSINLWDKPEAMLPMLDEHAKLIPEL